MSFYNIQASGVYGFDEVCLFLFNFRGFVVVSSKMKRISVIPM